MIGQKSVIDCPKNMPSPQKSWFIIAPPPYLEKILLNAIFITSHTFSQTSKN